MNDRILREHLVKLLTEPNAHATFEQIVDAFPAQHFGTLIDQFPHSAWQVLEHLRLCQWDILEFSRNPAHESPSFPDGYWPDKVRPGNKSDWKASADGFVAHLRQMVDLVSDPSNDLLKPFSYGDGQTLLREAMVLAKHNSYHLGQLALIKKALPQ